MCDQQRLRSAFPYAQTDPRLCLSLNYSMSVKLLTDLHLEFLSLKRGCRGSSESTLVKMPHRSNSHVTAHIKKKRRKMSILSEYKKVAKRYYIVFVKCSLNPSKTYRSHFYNYNLSAVLVKTEITEKLNYCNVQDPW